MTNYRRIVTVVPGLIRFNIVIITHLTQIANDSPVYLTRIKYLYLGQESTYQIVRMEANKECFYLCSLAEAPPCLRVTLVTIIFHIS